MRMTFHIVVALTFSAIAFVVGLFLPRPFTGLLKVTPESLEVTH